MQPLRTAVSAAGGGKNTKADYPTEVGEEVAVLGVEGHVAAIAILGGQRGKRVALHASSEPSVGIDDGGEAGIGIAQYPTSIFHRAHARHVQC
jgi:hypothetical protein